jgi:hypothetical protein
MISRLVVPVSFGVSVLAAGDAEFLPNGTSLEGILYIHRPQHKPTPGTEAEFKGALQ